MFKKRLKRLGQEQEDLFIAPSITTPQRLYEIAEEKRLIGEILALCGEDTDLMKGFLKGRYAKIMNKFMNGGYSESSDKYRVDYLAWLNVAMVVLSDQEIEEIIGIRHSNCDIDLTEELPSIMGMVKRIIEKISDYISRKMERNGTI